MLNLCIYSAPRLVPDRSPVGHGGEQRLHDEQIRIPMTGSQFPGLMGILACILGHMDQRILEGGGREFVGMLCSAWGCRSN